MGEILLIIRNPAIMLLIVRYLIGFNRVGMPLLMLIRVGKWGCPFRVRRMIQVL